MPTKPPKRAGRPKRDAVDALRAQVWFMAVADESGKTANALEAEFRADHGAVNRLSGLWGKYARGEVSPSNKLVAAVESVYPETAYWFHLPFWRLLRAAPITFEELKPIFFELADETMALLVFEDGQEEAFWRKPADVAATYRGLLKLESLEDSVTGILLLIQEAEFRQDLRQFSEGIMAWRLVRQRMRTSWPFSERVTGGISLLEAVESSLFKRWAGVRYTSDGRKWTSMVISPSDTESPG